MNLPKLTAEQSLGPADGVYTIQTSFERHKQMGVTMNMEQNQPSASFSDLPPELVLKIGGLLGIKDLSNLRQLSKYYKNLIDKSPKLVAKATRDWIEKNTMGYCYFPRENNDCNFEHPQNFYKEYSKETRYKKAFCCSVGGGSWKPDELKLPQDMQNFLNQNKPIKQEALKCSPCSK